MPTPRFHRFAAVIYKLGVNRCVDVPETVSRAFKPRRYVPVVVTVRGYSARTALVPGSAGLYRLFLDTAFRKAARADAGDPVQIALRLDTAPRELPIPSDLGRLLTRTPGARAAFCALTPALRREVLRWLAKAKYPATRRKRLARILSLLRQRPFPKPLSKKEA